jgi:integrase
VNAGSIVKRQWKRTVSWSVVVDRGADPRTGKRRQRWTTHKTRREAEAFLAATLAQTQIGASVPSARIRLQQYLPEWLEAARSRIRPTTWLAYSYCVRRHIVPELGDIPLLRLTAQAIEGWLLRMQAKQLSPATVHQAFRVLRTALRQAVTWGMIPRSPLSLVRSPRFPTREMQVWDEEQIRLFLAEAKRSSRYYTLYLAALLTGMRQGELLGLRWANIDWAFSRVSINHTLARVHRQVDFREPKSRRSRRTVALPPVLVEALKELQTVQEERRRQLRDGYENRDLVFCQQDGRPLHGHNVTQRDFRRIIRRASLPRIRFHDLRHCCATLLLRQGVHPKVVGEQLGHASVGITLDVYSHVLPGMQEDATRALADHLIGDGR